MSKQHFIKELSNFLLEHCADGFREGVFKGLELSEDEDFLYVNFPGNYTKIISIVGGSNFAIIKDLITQLPDAPLKK